MIIPLATESNAKKHATLKSVELLPARDCLSLDIMLLRDKHSHGTQDIAREPGLAGIKYAGVVFPDRLS